MFGFGVVGQGLYDILRTKDLNIELRKIAIRDAGKARSLPAEYFTTNAAILLEDPEINTIVELINDADAAFDIVSAALASGKNVVSANKKMIAANLETLINLQNRYGTSLLYEGAVCGSIPIIRNLEEYYDNELLHSVSGIFNGSSNYILSKIFNENTGYDAALKEAQYLGFAETDPTLDVGGFDAKYKLVIATAHAYGLLTTPGEVFNAGIQHLSGWDIQYAREKNYRIKLIPAAIRLPGNRVVLYVMPRLIRQDDFLYNVENEYNAVTVQAAFSDQQFFFGKGAGGHPTGSAVLSDITALRYSYQYEYKKFHHPDPPQLTSDYQVHVYLRYNDQAVLDALDFEEVYERLYTTGFNYVTGKISLASLIRNRELLSGPEVFIAEIGGTKTSTLVEQPGMAALEGAYG